MQALLLGLGTLLLSVAAVVFTAVNWSSMDAAAQGVVLMVLTLGAAVATATAARRSLPATAEALGLVTVVLALVDAHAVRITFGPEMDVSAFWAGGLAVVAVLAWALAGATGIRSTRLVAAVMAQLPLCLALAATEPGPALSSGLLLAQVAVVVLVTTPRLAVGRGLDGATRSWALAPAAFTWLVITTGTALWLTFDGARSQAGQVPVVAGAAAVALLAALAWAHRDDVRSSALAASTVTGLAFSGWLFRLLADAPVAWALVGLAGAAVVAVCSRLGWRWGSTPGAVATFVAGLVGCTLIGTVSTVVERMADVASTPWALAAADRALPSTASAADGDGAVAWACALHLIGLAALVGAWAPKLGRRASAVAALALVAVGVTVAPVVLPLSVGGAAAVGWLTAATLLVLTEGLLRTATEERPARDLLRLGSATSAALLVVTGSWAAATSSISIIHVAVAAVAAVWVLARAWWVQDMTVACLATGVVVLAVGVEAGLVAAVLGSVPVTAMAVAGAAALAAATVGLLVLPNRVSGSGEPVAWLLHAHAVLAVLAVGGGAAGTGTVGIEAAWRITLLSGVLAAGIRATRPSGRADHFAALAAAEGLALVWLELAMAAVSAPEPYTLPLAAVLAAAGLVADRRAMAVGQRVGSWVTAGPALVVAAVPTVWVSVVDPTGPRPLIALVVAVAVLAAGAFTGRRALVDVGAATVGVLGLARLLPVLAAAPNWLVIGLAGAVLLAVGATFEERRQDVRGVRDRYGALQ